MVAGEMSTGCSDFSMALAGPVSCRKVKTIASGESADFQALILLCTSHEKGVAQNASE